MLDDIVHIGSSNFDIRSLYLNLEMMLRVDDPGLRDDDARIISSRSWRRCEPITPELHRKRSGC